MNNSVLKTTYRTFDCEGFQLGCSIEGSGPDAFVIGSSVYYPRTFSSHLRTQLRLIFLDHRGFGKALGDYTQSSFELTKLVDDIESARQQLGLGSIILIGHSGHGYIALEYAKRYPEHVSKLVLIALSPNSSPESFAAADRYFQESVCPERKALLAENMRTFSQSASNAVPIFIQRMLMFGPMIWYQYDYDAAWLWQGVSVIPEMFDYVWGKVFRELDSMQGINAVTCPVFLALGRYDYWNPPHLWERVRSQFGDLTIRVFEKSGHTPQLEEPEDFDTELLRWLDLP